MKHIMLLVSRITYKMAVKQFKIRHKSNLLVQKTTKAQLSNKVVKFTFFKTYICHKNCKESFRTPFHEVKPAFFAITYKLG